MLRTGKVYPLHRRWQRDPHCVPGLLADAFNDAKASSALGDARDLAWPWYWDWTSCGHAVWKRAHGIGLLCYCPALLVRFRIYSPNVTHRSPEGTQKAGSGVEHVEHVWNKSPAHPKIFSFFWDNGSLKIPMRFCFYFFLQGSWEVTSWVCFHMVLPFAFI